MFLEVPLKNRRFSQAAYRRNIRAALGRSLRPGETTAFANNGDLVIYGASSGIVGRLDAERVERFIK